jgi:hypothetical protein
MLRLKKGSAANATANFYNFNEPHVVRFDLVLIGGGGRIVDLHASLRLAHRLKT